MTVSLLKIEFSLPDLEGRANILRIHAKSMSVERDIRWELISRLCPNATGAELARFVLKSGIGTSLVSMRNTLPPLVLGVVAYAIPIVLTRQSLGTQTIVVCASGAGIACPLA